MTLDRARALIKLYGPITQCTDASTRESMIRTWLGLNAIPTDPQLQAADDAFLADRAAEAPVNIYLQSHKTNRPKFLKALYALESGIDLHTTQGANIVVDYQAAFTSAMTIVNQLPQPYIDNLNKQRDLDGVAVPIANLTTVALCRQFAATLRGWLNTRAIMADTAADVSDY